MHLCLGQPSICRGKKTNLTSEQLKLHTGYALSTTQTSKTLNHNYHDFIYILLQYPEIAYAACDFHLNLSQLVCLLRSLLPDLLELVCLIRLLYLSCRLVNICMYTQLDKLYKNLLNLQSQQWPLVRPNHWPMFNCCHIAPTILTYNKQPLHFFHESRSPGAHPNHFEMGGAPAAILVPLQSIFLQIAIWSLYLTKGGLSPTPLICLWIPNDNVLMFLS